MSGILSDIDLLARLVSFDSTSRYSNLPIAEFITDYLDHTRIEIVRNFNQDQTKVNLIARLGSDRSTDGNDKGRSGLVLSGHMDVVPADEPDWDSDPFTLTELEDRYVGRGACDMKGFVALAINSIRRAAADDCLAQPLVLILTFDEEPGTLGAQHLAQTWSEAFPLPRSAIIGEPTSLHVVRMHKGHTKIRVTVRGQSAHSGYPHLGKNAIEPMGRIIASLSTLRQRWESNRVESSVWFPETPFVTLNMGTIHGGSAMNVVPERCVLELGFRTLPGMNSELLIAEARQAILCNVDTASVEVELVGDSPPLLTDESSTVHRQLCSLIGQTETVAVSYASDAGPLSTMGMECVVWGPGTIEVAHKPNESMPKAEFSRARVLLNQAVEAFCK